jgi:DNA-binding MarR family transcriptional regulator
MSHDAQLRPLPHGDEWLHLDRQLCFALYASSLAMTKLYKPLLAPLGLTYPQYLVMLVLWQDGTSSVSALGERLSLDSGTLTPLLKRLELAGHVTRARDPGDERRVQVALTACGHALKTQALALPPTLACATSCDLAELQSLTQRLHDLLGRLRRASVTNPA